MARGETEKMRAVWHAMFGVLAIIFGQVISVDYATKVALVRQIGFTIIGLDVLIRLPWYHLFIKFEDVRGWSYLRRKVRLVGIFLEKWLLIKTGILRREERGLPATVIPFVLGIIIPIECGIPLYAVMVGVIVLGFGDPAAREFAIWCYTRFKFCHRVRKNGKKTWQGFWGFVFSASIAVIVSLMLDDIFPIYPSGQMLQLVCALVLGIFAGAFAELAQEVIEAKTKNWSNWIGKTIRLLFDDNFTIPIATAFVVALMMWF